MVAKKYIVYRPDESDLTCRLYVRCDCGRYGSNFKCDPCEDEDEKKKNCDEKKQWHDRCEEEHDWHDRCEEEHKRHDRCEEEHKKPWSDEEEPEHGGRRYKRSKKGWYDTNNGDEDDREHEKKCGEHHYHWKPECPKVKQTHVHEFEGSTKLAEEDEDRHNHRFAGVSGEEIPIPGGHVHRIITRTDFFDHFHEICRLTGPAIYVDCDDGHDDKKGWKNRKHVHFVKGWTTCVDDHKHEFQAATLIESPLLPLNENTECQG